MAIEDIYNSQTTFIRLDIQKVQPHNAHLYEHFDNPVYASIICSYGCIPTRTFLGPTFSEKVKKV